MDIKPPYTRFGTNKPNQYCIWAQAHIFHWIIQGIKEEAHRDIKIIRPTIQVNDQGVGPTCHISRRPIKKSKDLGVGPINLNFKNLK